MTTLVVGRGLLGRAVVRELKARGFAIETVYVPWDRPVAALRELLAAAERAARCDNQWRLVWTAGAGVVATPAADLDAEAACFESFVARVVVPPAAMFLASSAGGVYAGSPDTAPFTEASAVNPTSPYGRTKLAMEQSASALADRGSRVLVGRIANLYGPGQNLLKPQGLVSQLCLTHLSRKPLEVYASMDSLRDYLFVRDAATMVVSGLDRLGNTAPGDVVVKILASGESRSVGSVIGESTRAFRRRPQLVIRSAASQIMDLRLRSTVWPDLQSSVETPFLVGLHATADDIGSRISRGNLSLSA